ncbi:hypothetical protein PRIPAC_97410 [Pristionchus pacificus]|uniref:Uncharacterized protein n=1 Tax=Pristionchus pacificus TaxID=54126 RepID=A0A2A6CUS8_PRIPA|nr:hypothetical protein PRIPAC_97410 [Pristionchus pacificus]|eukprot:PDM81935.1 hypothetical protein PRIPAC_34089 [Pristionchus pacificus]
MEQQMRSMASLPQSLPAATVDLTASTHCKKKGVIGLEMRLEEVRVAMSKAHAARRYTLHILTSDPIVFDMIKNMREHMRTEFRTFGWTLDLNERTQEILRKISALTLMVEVTIQYVSVKQREPLMQRVTNHVESAYNFILSIDSSDMTIPLLPLDPIDASPPPTKLPYVTLQSPDEDIDLLFGKIVYVDVTVEYTTIKKGIIRRFADRVCAVCKAMKILCCTSVEDHPAWYIY